MADIRYGDAIFADTSGHTVLDLTQSNAASVMATGPLDLTVDVVRDYNASGSSQATTGSISASSSTLTLAAAEDFKNGQGISIANAGALPTINAPTAATATAEGTTGSTSIDYAVAALYDGGITASFAFSLTDANATLSSTDYVSLSVTSVTSANGYAWYRTSTSGTSPTTTGFIGITTSTTLSDTGLAISTPPIGIPSSAPSTALGSTLVTTISSGGGTTTIVLADSATTSVSSSIVNHDDTSAIQSAINAAAGSAMCEIGSIGHTMIVGGLELPSNTVLSIKCTLKLRDNVNVPVILIEQNASNVAIFGYGIGIIDGNLSNNQIPTANSTVNGNACIATPLLDNATDQNVSNVYIDSITMQNCMDWTLNLAGVNGAVVNNCIFYNGGTPCQFSAVSSNCWIVNSTIYGTTGDTGFAFYGGTYNSGIYNCELHDNNGAGIEILNDSSQSSPCYNIFIANNDIYSNGKMGIFVVSNQTTVVDNFGITIQGNIIFNNGQLNDGVGAGITINHGTAVSISNNIIHHDGNGTAGVTGIQLNDTAAYITIIGNIIYDEGQGSSGVGVGITVTSTNPYILITDNLIYDDQTTKTMAYCLNGTCGDNTIVRNNYLGTTIGSPNNFTAGTSNRWEGNFGYNPVGNISAPSIPSSGAAYANSNPYTCRVFVYGGTVTAIAINSTTTGITSGMVELAPGETVTLTYSSAPSWTWFGL